MMIAKYEQRQDPPRAPSREIDLWISKGRPIGLLVTPSFEFVALD